MTKQATGAWTARIAPLFAATALAGNYPYAGRLH